MVRKVINIKEHFESIKENFKNDFDSFLKRIIKYNFDDDLTYSQEILYEKILEFLVEKRINLLYTEKIIHNGIVYFRLIDKVYFN